jgi:chromosomal replication initiator protein
MDAEPVNAYWNEILDVVRHRVPQQTFDTWFHPLRPGAWTESGLEIHCPDRFFMDWFSEHHLAALNAAASEHFGRPTACRLAVDAAQAEARRELLNARPEPVLAALGADGMLGPVPAPASARPRNQLNPDYTFDSFVIGSGTRLACAASVAVSRKLGGSYNPLFIHGGVGLGKTHLMHAIGNAALAARPDCRVCYVTAEQFMNDLIRSIQQNRTYDFKRDYRSVDVLLVDDVAFLAGKESTQEEFFHTFNALYNENKQIVLTSDRSPKEITTLEERLRSRFEWGLITDIQPPDLETRIAILKKKVEANNIYISDDVIQFIAENITKNIRKLEGALIKLLAFASLTGHEISLEMASEALSSFFQAAPARVVTIADVMGLVAERFHVTVDQLKSKKRTQDLALARQVAMFVAREKVGASLNQIGQAFGNRDHTTVLHACQKIAALESQDPLFRGKILDLLAAL